MNSHLAALREIIVAETVATHPDFCFCIVTDPDGNLTADYRGTWEPERTPEPHRTPYLTMKHDGEQFIITHYQWSDYKRYKTLKGAAKYVNDELKASCDRRREQKAKADAEKEFKEKSLRLLTDLHNQLVTHGIESKLCLIANRYNYDHLSIDATRVDTRIDITVTSDYRLEMVFPYPRMYTAPETAIDILSALSQKGSA